MTWKEFKEKVEEAGVKDDMKIEYIDISDGSMYENCEKWTGLNIHIDENNSFTVTP